MIGALVLTGMLGASACVGDVAKERGRPLLGVQRWDMYSGKGATQAQELGYRPGKQGFLKDPQWHDHAPFFGRDIERFGAMHEYYQPEDGEPILNRDFQNWNYLVLNMMTWFEGKDPVTGF